MILQELMQWYDFTGKTAVITGGTGVLGGEMACALVGCGADVAVLDRNPNLPDELKTPIDAGPGKYMVAHADILQRDSLSEMAKTVLETFGSIDILVNAAGGNQQQVGCRQVGRGIVADGLSNHYRVENLRRFRFFGYRSHWMSRLG